MPSSRTAALLVLLVLLVGCQMQEEPGAPVPAVDDAGPLLFGEAEIDVCLPVAVGQRMSLGIDVLEAADDADIVIQDVRLEGADGLSLTAASLVPLPGTNYVGVHSSYPPPADLLEQAGLAQAWESRIELQEGATVPLDSAGSLNLVLGLQATDENGEASAVTIDYRSSGEDFSATSSTAVRLPPAEQDC